MFARAIAAAICVGALVPRSSYACGSSGPDGVSACSLAEYDEAQRPPFRLGLSAVYTSTVIRFSSTLQAGETRFASVAELSYAPTAHLTLTAGLGAAAGGKLLAPDGVHDFTPGLVSSLGVSYRLVNGPTPLGRGFVIVSSLVSLTASATQVGDQGPYTAYDALDLRAGLAAGFTWLHRLSGYGVVRAFGGPVYWTYQGASQLGTDTHHYQVGGGLALLLARRLEIFIEGVPLGEQAVAGGAAMSF